MTPSESPIVRFEPEYRQELIDKIHDGEGGAFVKTARIFAIQIKVPFIVRTEHGDMAGSPGDWLATNHPLDDRGSDIWPISAERFRNTYTAARDFGILQAALDADARTARDRTLGELAGQPVPYQEYSPDASPSSPADASPGRWAFLSEETGDWIEVKPGTVFVTDTSPRAARDDTHELGGQG